MVPYGVAVVEMVHVVGAVADPGHAKLKYHKCKTLAQGEVRSTRCYEEGKGVHNPSLTLLWLGLT